MAKTDENDKNEPMTETEQHESEGEPEREEDADAAQSKRTKVSAKKRRAEFIRQASVPLDRLSGEADQYPSEQPSEPQSPPLHSRWLRTPDSGKGWKSFSVKDSRELESAWIASKQAGLLNKERDEKKDKEEEKPAAEWSPIDPDEEAPIYKVPVTLDKLYDADLQTMKMTPVFWKGPQLPIIRASWFYESSSIKPCPVDLADELEQQFKTIKPWLSSYTDELKSSVSLGSDAEDKLKCHLKTLKNSYVIFQGPRLARLYTKDFSNMLSKQLFTAWSGEHAGGQLLIRGYQTQQQLVEVKKGGSANNASPLQRSADEARKRKSATTESSPVKNTVKLETSSSPSKLAHELSKALKETPEATGANDAAAASEAKRSKSSQAASTGSPVPEPTPGAPSVDVTKTNASAIADIKKGAGAQLRSLALAARKQSAAGGNELLKNMVTRLGGWAEGASLTPKQQEEVAASLEEARKKVQDLDGSSHYATSEDEHDTDHVAENGETPSLPYSKKALDDPEAYDDEEDRKEVEAGRDHIPELIFAIHGIGQRLADDWKSFDFTLALNTFRDLVQQRIDTAKPPSDIGGKGLKGVAENRRIQLIPILWRTGFHIEDGEDGQAAEGEDNDDDDDFDNGTELDMDHIFSDDGIPVVRTLVREVLMDIPMYLSKHRQHIINSVIREANRQYRLFAKRNPEFESQNGRTHIVAHSLGSAIATDILSNQPTTVPPLKELSAEDARSVDAQRLLFNVKNLLTIGSPVGLFFVLNRAQLIARKGLENHMDEDAPKRKGISLDQEGKYGCMAVSGFYNLWNQFDPVATRCTPCVDIKYAKALKPIAIGKATRAVLRTDKDAIPPMKTSAPKEADSSTSQKATAGSEKRASTGFFSSWGRKSGAAASAFAAEDKKTDDKEDDEEASKDGKEEELEDVQERMRARAKAEEEKQRKKKEEEAKESQQIDPKRKERAEARLKALNPMQRVDYVMPLEGYSLLSSINQYTELMTAHMSYWSRTDFADFLVAQLLATPARLHQSLAFKEDEGWD